MKSVNEMTFYEALLIPVSGMPVAPIHAVADANIGFRIIQTPSQSLEKK